MKTQAMGLLVLNAALAVGIGAGTAHASAVPQDWVVLPEDTRNMGAAAASASDEKPSDEQVGRILTLNGEALDGLRETRAGLSAPGERPKDWTPWHLEYFTTDLAITAQGLIGVLTIKGTPSVQAFWRRQGQKPPLPTASSKEASEMFALEGPDGSASPELEPSIRAAVASGKIRDEAAFRRNLGALSRSLQAMAESLDSRQGSPWWVSGFRIDFSVEASGKISFVTVGADLRLRFEWKRIMRPAPAGSLAAAAAPRDPALAPIADGLQALTRVMRQDLERMVEDKKLAKAGFSPYSFRVGFGVTAKGDVGVVKGSSTAIGHVNFSRDVKKPVVYPLAMGPETGDETPLLVIENRPSAAHLAFARKEGVEFTAIGRTAGGDPEQVVYRVGRERFRRGLAKALRMGAFFAKPAQESSGRKWKVHTLKSGLDISLLGDLGFAAVGGVAAFDMGFYNQKF